MNLYYMKIWLSVLFITIFVLFCSCSEKNDSIIPSETELEGIEKFSFNEILHYTQKYGGAITSGFINTESQTVDTKEEAIELAKLEIPKYFERNTKIDVEFDRKNKIWSVCSRPDSPYINNDDETWVVIADGGATVYIGTDGITKLITQDG